MAESNKAPKITDAQRRKDELIAELARSRSGMTLHAGQVKYQSDVPRRLKSSFRDHVGVWLTGALVTGGAISLLPAREKKVYVNPLSKTGRAKAKTKIITEVENPKKAGFWVTLLGLLMPIIKPIATRLLTKHLSTYLEGPGVTAKTDSGTPDTAAAAI